MADETGDAPLQSPDGGQRYLLAALILRLRGVVSTWLSSAPLPIDTLALGDLMRSSLLDGHAQAAFLGRTLGGSTLPMSDADRLFATSVMEEQDVYLSRFMAEIDAGKYAIEDEAGLDALVRRASMYADLVLGTANQAWAEMQEADTDIAWILGGGKNCADCPDIAGGSPYKRDTLPCYPGDGSTTCLGNCGCTLEALSVRAFSRADQADL